MTAVNYSEMLLICKSVLHWKQLYLFRVRGPVLPVLSNRF